MKNPLPSTSRERSSGEVPFTCIFTTAFLWRSYRFCARCDSDCAMAWFAADATLAAPRSKISTERINISGPPLWFDHSKYGVESLKSSQMEPDLVGPQF